MNLTLKVPVKPHVKKYLRINYGENYKLSKRDCIGILLFQMLRRPITDARLDGRINKCTEKFAVDLSSYNFFKRGCKNVDSHTITQFNALVDNLMLSEFYAYVDNLVAFGVQQKDAITGFMDKYEFEESDIKFDALKKSYQRYRNFQDSKGRKIVTASDALPMICLLKVFSSQKAMTAVKNAA